MQGVLIDMENKDILDSIKKHKYIFIGEIHGTKEIPEIVFSLMKPILNEKIIFCLELPQSAEKVLHQFFEGRITEKKLFSSDILKDSVSDGRFNKNTLSLYKSLHDNRVIIKCLEDYDCEDISKRDENIAKRFLEIIKKENADKYFVYAGNCHTINESVQIQGFTIKPIKIYFQKDFTKKILTISFSVGCSITFSKKTNTFDYALQYKAFNNIRA